MSRTVQVYMRLRPEQKREIDFIIMQLQGDFCLSEARVLFENVKPKKMTITSSDTDVHWES